MRTTLNIEEKLIHKAKEMTGIHEKTHLVRLGLEALIARDSSKRLAKLGGTERKLRTVPRRRGARGDIVEALQESLKGVIETGRRVLEKTPPELVADIMDRGVALCGGGALLRGVDKLQTKSLGIPAYLVDNPMTCVVEGAVKAIPMYNILRRSLPPV